MWERENVSGLQISFRRFFFPNNNFEEIKIIVIIICYKLEITITGITIVIFYNKDSTKITITITFLERAWTGFHVKSALKPNQISHKPYGRG